jgi:hypothetical protein
MGYDFLKEFILFGKKISNLFSGDSEHWEVIAISDLSNPALDTLISSKPETLRENWIDKWNFYILIFNRNYLKVTTCFLWLCLKQLLLENYLTVFIETPSPRPKESDTRLVNQMKKLSGFVF